MATQTTASERILDAITFWEGVHTEQEAARRGQHQARQAWLGHLHGDRSLHIGFPKAIWHELHDQGRIDYHSVFPGRPGYAARRLENEEDVEDAIALLRINYDRAIERHGASSDTAA